MFVVYVVGIQCLFYFGDVDGGDEYVVVDC